MNTGDIVSFFKQHGNVTEVAIYILGVLLLLAMRRWVKPIFKELATGKLRMREDDDGMTVKDLLIETFRTTNRTEAKVEELERRLADVETEVQDVKNKVEDHAKELHHHLSNGKDFKS